MKLSLDDLIHLVRKEYSNELEYINGPQAKKIVGQLIADYIESIELPEKKLINKNKYTVDERRYPAGYNTCLKDCQAKLDEAVRSLRNG